MKVLTSFAFILFFAGLVRANCNGIYAYSVADSLNNADLDAGSPNILTCSDGYQYGTGTYSISVTCDGTDWRDSSNNIRADCSPIPDYCLSTFTLGTLQNPTGQAIGSVATLDCDSGYRATTTTYPGNYDSIQVTCVVAAVGNQGSGSGTWAVYDIAQGTTDLSITCAPIPDFCPTLIEDTSVYQRLIIDFFTASSDFAYGDQKTAYCGLGFVTPFSAPSVTVPTGGPGQNVRPTNFRTSETVLCLDDGVSTTNKNRALGGAWYYVSSTSTKATCVKVQGYCNQYTPIPGLNGPDGTPSDVTGNSPLGELDGNPNGPEGYASCARGYSIVPSDRFSGIPTYKSNSSIQCYPGTDIQGEWWIEYPGGGSARAFCEKLDDYCENPDTVNPGVSDYNFRSTFSRSIATSVTNDRVQISCDPGFEFNGLRAYYGRGGKETKGFVFCRPDYTGLSYISNANSQDFAYGIFVDSVQPNAQFGACTLINFYCPSTQNGNDLYDSRNFATATVLNGLVNIQYDDTAFIDCPPGSSADGTQSAPAPQTWCRDYDQGWWASGNTWDGEWKNSNGGVSSCSIIFDFCPAPSSNMQYFAYLPYHNTPSTSDTTKGFRDTTSNPWSESWHYSYWFNRGTDRLFSWYSLPIGGSSTTNFVGWWTGTTFDTDYYLRWRSTYKNETVLTDVSTTDVSTVFDNRFSFRESIRGTRGWAVCDDGYGYSASIKYFQSSSAVAIGNVAREIFCEVDANMNTPANLAQGITDQYGRWVQTSNGQALGTCSKLIDYCDKTTSVSNGAWAPTATFPINTPNTFYCDPGYSQSAGNTASEKTFAVTCQDPSTGANNVGDAVGEWDVPPQCSVITDYCPHSIAFSDFSSGTNSIGDTRTINCNSGYSLTGTSTGRITYLATCVADNDANIYSPPSSGSAFGKWVFINPSTGSSVPAQCLPADGICQRAIFDQSSFTATTFNVTSTGTLTCKDGYGISSLTPSYTPTTSVYCEAVQAGTTLTYGQWVINPPGTTSVPLAGDATQGLQTCELNPIYCPSSQPVANSDSVVLAASTIDSTGVVTCNLGYGEHATFRRVYQLDCLTGTGAYPTHGEWRYNQNFTNFDCQPIPNYCSSLSQFENPPRSQFDTGSTTGDSIYTGTRTVQCDSGFRFVAGGSQTNDLGSTTSLGIGYSNTYSTIECVDNADTASLATPTADSGYWSETHAVGVLGFPVGRDIVASAATSSICRPVDLCNGVRYFTNAVNVLTVVSGNTISGYTASSGSFFIDAVATATCLNGYMPQGSSADTFWTNPTQYPLASGAFNVECEVDSASTPANCAGSLCYAWRFLREGTSNVAGPNSCTRTNNYCPLNFVDFTLPSPFGRQRSESLEFGTLTLVGASAFVNSQANIQCDAGYQASTFTQYIAGTDKPDPAGSALFGTQVTTVQVSCKPDESPDAAAVPAPDYMVNYIGDWKYNDIPFACVPIPQYCVDPTVPFNQGSIQLPGSYSRAVYEDTLQYCCDAGYIITGTAAGPQKTRQVQCVPPPSALTTYQTNYGIWIDLTTGVAPSCEKRDLYCVNDPSNAAVSTTAARQVGDSATITCDTGYQFSDATTSKSFTCTAAANSCTATTTGSWVNTPLGAPVCQKIQDYCPIPVATGGTISAASDPYAYDSTYTLTCSQGFSTDGTPSGALSAVARCQANRTWTSASCTQITTYCTQSAAVIGQTATINLVTGYTIGSQLAFTCKNSWTVFGLNLTAGGLQSGSLNCTYKVPTGAGSLGAFTDAGVQPICQAQKGICPKSLPNTVSPATSGDQGANATFVCNTGYSADGTRTGATSVSSTCVLQIATQIGQWQDASSRPMTGCIEILDYCPATYTDGTTGTLTAIGALSRVFNAAGTFVCANGYKFGGLPTESAKCVQDTSIVSGVGGKWVDSTNNAVAPRCTAFSGYCKTPATGATTPYSSITPATPSIGNNVDYVCNSGYFFSTTNTVSSFTATCNAFNLTDGSLTFSGSPAVCIKNPTYCPASLPQGTITGVTTVGAGATLSCAAGYNGPSSISCQPDTVNPAVGTWVQTSTTTVAACSIVQGYCPAQSTGLVTLPAGTITTTRTITCDQGFELAGGATSSTESCSSGSIWVDTTSGATIGSCVAVPNWCVAPANGVLSTVSNPSTIVGTTADLSCATGYSFSGTNSVSFAALTCTGLGWIDVATNIAPSACIPITQYCPISFSLAALADTSLASIGDTNSFTCSTGAFSSTNASTGSITCSASGTWTYGTGTFTDCSLGAICSASPFVPNMYNVTSSGNTINSIATVTCNSGYGVFDGVGYSATGSSVCTLSGWSSVTCDFIPLPSSTFTSSPTPIPTLTPTPTLAPTPTLTPTPVASPTPTPNPPTSSPPTSNPPTSSPPTSNPPTSSPPTSNPPTSSTVDSGSMLVLSIALLAL